MDTKQNLLPEREYTPWTEEMIEARKIASQNTIKFNTTGDMDILREMFSQSVPTPSSTPPSILPTPKSALQALPPYVALR